MASRGSKWLLGCGIGCFLILVGFLAVLGGGAFWVRGLVNDFDTVLESRDALEERYGETASFVPQPDGAIPPERVESFLAVRKQLADERERIVEILATLDVDPEWADEPEPQSFAERMRFTLDASRSALDMAPAMAGFFETRNRALLEAEMGLGEYTYIYCLVYYSWLGYEPDAFPADESETEQDDTRPRGGSRTGAILAEPVMARVREDLREILSSQLATIPDGQDGEWPEKLAAEIDLLRSDEERYPWQAGLPPAIERSVEPYREELMAEYGHGNAFALARNRRRGRASFTTE